MLGACCIGGGNITNAKANYPHCRLIAFWMWHQRRTASNTFVFEMMPRQRRKHHQCCWKCIVKPPVLQVACFSWMWHLRGQQCQRLIFLEGCSIKGGNITNAAAKPAMPQFDYFFWMWHCKEASNATG